MGRPLHSWGATLKKTPLKNLYLIYISCSTTRPQGSVSDSTLHLATRAVGEEGWVASGFQHWFPAAATYVACPPHTYPPLFPSESDLGFASQIQSFWTYLPLTMYLRTRTTPVWIRDSPNYSRGTCPKGCLSQANTWELSHPASDLALWCQNSHGGDHPNFTAASWMVHGH